MKRFLNYGVFPTSTRQSRRKTVEKRVCAPREPDGLDETVAKLKQGQVRELVDALASAPGVIGSWPPALQKLILSGQEAS